MCVSEDNMITINIKISQIMRFINYRYLSIIILSQGVVLPYLDASNPLHDFVMSDSSALI